MARFRTKHVWYDMAMAITVHQTRMNQFTVTYGQQVKKGLNYEQAAHELGECMFHALCCDGMIEQEDSDVD